MGKGNKNRSKAAMRKEANIKDIESTLRFEQTLAQHGLASNKPDQEIFGEDVPMTPSATAPSPAAKKMSRRQILTATKQQQQLSEATIGLKFVRSMDQALLLRKTNKLYRRNMKYAAEKDKFNSDAVVEEKSVAAQDNKIPAAAAKSLLMPIQLMPSDVRNTFMQHLETKTIRRPGTSKKGDILRPSSRPAIEKPHAGLSYNPTKAARDSLVNDLMSKSTRAAAVARAHRERKSAGKKKLPLGKKRQDDPEKDLPEPASQKDTNNPATTDSDRKTVSQRNRERRKQTLERNQQIAKQMRLMENDIYNVKSILKKLKLDEKTQEDKQFDKAVKYVDPERTRRLGRLRYELPPSTIKLKKLKPITDATVANVGSLRKITPAGDLLSDRWHSLQQRNVVEPRKRAVRKRKHAKKSYLVKTNLIPELAAKFDAQMGLV